MLARNLKLRGNSLHDKGLRFESGRHPFGNNKHKVIRNLISDRIEAFLDQVVDHVLDIDLVTDASCHLKEVEGLFRLVPVPTIDCFISFGLEPLVCVCR